MRRNALWLMGLVCWLSLLPVFAQSMHPVITSDNAGGLELLTVASAGYVLDLAYAPDGSSAVVAGDTLWRYPLDNPDASPESYALQEQIVSGIYMMGSHRLAALEGIE